MRALIWLRRHPRAGLPLALAVIAIAVLAQLGGRSAGPRIAFTLGELEAIHAGMQVGARPVQGSLRLSDGDAIDTGAEGRGRLRLDDGTTVLLDRSTRLRVTSHGLALEEGRAFAEASAGAHAEIAAGGVTALVSSSSVGFEKTAGEVRIYCANGEVQLSAGARQERVRTGETATVTGADVKVAPEKAWSDWTSGMANPWGQGGAPRRAIGELWGRGSDRADDTGSPLAIRSHAVDAKIEGEVALTRVETTYFNGGSSSLLGDFRMQLPPAAIVSRFAVRRGERVQEGAVREAKDDSQWSDARLEWAGGGWVRGQVSSVPAGDTVAVIVEYVEWLSPAKGTLVYRYPMAADGDPPLIGELRVRVDTREAHPRAVAVAAGSTLDDGVFELRRADVRPAADFVVEMQGTTGAARDEARAYVVKAPEGEPSADPYVLVRADVPTESAPTGVALAIVVDTSWSVAPATLDAERGVVDAILGGLGPRDRVAVFGGDQAARSVGPKDLGAVDDARRKALHDALLAETPGGATDLAAELERAADALPADADAAMVVYVGDGWPTLGDTDIAAIRTRLERRARGAPRIAAIAVGPGANRHGLVALAHGSGPVLDVADRADAATAATSLVATALVPAVDGVSLDLGATVDRIYPRGNVVVPGGTTLTVVGRLRGELPSSSTLRYRRGGELKEERRALSRRHASSTPDVRRRWASARIADLALDGQGLETVVDLALRTSLLTPWTAWAAADGSPPPIVRSTPVGARVLDLGSVADAAYAFRIAPAGPSAGALIEAPTDRSATAEEDWRAALTSRARRTIDDARAAAIKCRDLRAALRPEVGGTLRVRVKIDGDGHATDVTVRAVTSRDDDASLDRCVQTLVSSLTFFDSGDKDSLVVEHDLTLAYARSPRKTQCSRASTLPLALRRGIWRARAAGAQSAAGVFSGARDACELPTWGDQRALLEVLLEKVRPAAERVALARAIDDLGVVDAAAFVRRAAVRDAAGPVELAAIRKQIVGDEPVPGKAFEKKYGEARSDEDRLAVVRRFLRLSPHDGMLRRKLFALLEKTGARDVLVAEIYAARQDPFTDAALLGDGASALRRLGREDEGRRVFGELVERAPRDPYARAYLGDRLRDEGLFDDATAAYGALSALVPGDPAAEMRLALAHAGAGRLDVATRMLARVAQTGGRGDDTKLGELASVTTAVLLASARAQGGPDAARLEQRALEVSLPELAGVVLVRTPTLDEPLTARVLRGAQAAEGKAKEGDKAKGGDKAKEGDLPDLLAPTMGLYGVRLERGERSLAVSLSRPSAFGSGRPIKVQVDLLVFGEDRKAGPLLHKEVVLPADGTTTEVRWDGEMLR